MQTITVITSNRLGETMGWLGIDDTDHLGGGCTTHTLLQLLNGLDDSVAFTNLRLVRLWPFAKQRTRGNAAVAVELITDDENTLIEHLDKWWNEKIKPLRGDLTKSQFSDREQYPTDPGMVWFSKQPEEKFYWDVVRQEVTIEEIPNPKKIWGGHGVIGAAAAVSWRAKTSTFEAISWRINHSMMKSTTRKIDLELLTEVDEDPDTFMSRDPRSDNVLIAPRGNCPVLFGIRARTLESAKRNCELLINSPNTEDIEGYMVFETNQATDDHLGEDRTSTVIKTTVMARGTVKIETEKGILMAFSESGDIKNLAQWLMIGDVINYNGLTHFDGSIHLERLKIVTAIPSKSRPICAKCNVNMKSMGKGQSVRCPKCRNISKEVWIEKTRVPPFSKWVQPPMDSRRHLSKPLDWD